MKLFIFRQNPYNFVFTRTYQMKAPKKSNLGFVICYLTWNIPPPLPSFPAERVILLVGPGSSSQNHLHGSALSHIISWAINKVLLLTLYWQQSANYSQAAQTFCCHGGEKSTQRFKDSLREEGANAHLSSLEEDYCCNQLQPLRMSFLHFLRVCGAAKSCTQR